MEVGRVIYVYCVLCVVCVVCVCVVFVCVVCCVLCVVCCAGGGGERLPVEEDHGEAPTGQRLRPYLKPHGVARRGGGLTGTEQTGIVLAADGSGDATGRQWLRQ